MIKSNSPLGAFSRVHNRGICQRYYHGFLCVVFSDHSHRLCDDGRAMMLSGDAHRDSATFQAKTVFFDALPCAFPLNMHPAMQKARLRALLLVVLDA